MTKDPGPPADTGDVRRLTRGQATGSTVDTDTELSEGLDASDTLLVAIPVSPSSSVEEFAAPLSPTPSESRLVLAFYFASWFFLNIVITLYCKALFSVYAFPFPMVMTIIHMIFTYTGVKVTQSLGLHAPKRPPPGARRTILWFSVVFTVNIWLSNAGLQAVSVSLHQVVRTLVPLFTMFLSLIIYNERYASTLVLPVLTVIGGVAITVWGDMDATLHGLIIVVLGCFFSSLKGIITQKTQVGALGLPSLDLLRYLCPLAIAELLLLALSMGEIESLLASNALTPALCLHLCVLGVVAFFLNFVSFRCAALLSPLTLNVAGNVKQVLTSLLGVIVFGGTLTPALCLGIVGTAVGASWYSHEMNKWQATTKLPTSTPPTSTTPEGQILLKERKRGASGTALELAGKVALAGLHTAADKLQ